jgi:UDP-glucuronate decarboxylase
MAYHRRYGLDVRIARIFNSYGPRLRSEGAYGRVVSRFITQALTNQPMTIFGDGAQTRSFCYVTDTVSGLLLFLVNGRVKGEVLNIGNNEEVTILKLAEKIKQLTSSASPIIFHPLPVDDPRRRCPDIGRAMEALGWRPHVNLREGLDRTIRWFESQLRDD